MGGHSASAAHYTGHAVTGGHAMTGAHSVAGGHSATGRYLNTNEAVAVRGQITSGYTSRRQSASVATGQVIKGAERVVATNVVGREFGTEKVISVTERVDESRSHVVNETVSTRTVKVPKRVVREEIIEKVIVVPERIVHEEVIEEDAVVEERIIEVAKPIIVEKIVEVPEIEIVEKIIEVPEVRIEERVVHVPRVEIRENIVEVPKIITQEKIVEVPEIQYRDIPVERIVEVPQIRVEEVVKHVTVPQYVDKPVPEYVTVEVAEDIHRKLPIPVEAITTFEYKLPQFKPKYRQVKYPVYLPRFIEVPVAAELVSAEMAVKMNSFTEKLTGIQNVSSVSMCTLEEVASSIQSADLVAQVQRSGVSIEEAVRQAWESGLLVVNESGRLVMTGSSASYGIGDVHHGVAHSTHTHGAIRAVHASGMHTAGHTASATTAYASGYTTGPHTTRLASSHVSIHATR